MIKEEIEKEIENLNYLLEFHSQGFIKKPEEYEKHINDILDMIAELKEELKKK